jgi:hypothetical protein
MLRNVIIVNFLLVFIGEITDFTSIIKPQGSEVPSYYLLDKGAQKEFQDTIESIFKNSINFTLSKELTAHIKDYKPYTKSEIEIKIKEIDTGRFIKKFTYSNRPFLVYAIDSREFKGLVYDSNRRKNQGTNAQEILSILANQKDMEIVQLRVNASWTEVDEVAKAQPDLIIIHKSAFEEDERDNTAGEKRLIDRIETISQLSPRTNFIIYSRTDNFKRRFPLPDKLPKDRIYHFEVENGTFMNGDDRLKLRNKVKEIREKMGL